MTDKHNTPAIRDVRKYKLVHSNDYQSQMLVRPDGSWVKHDDYLALCDALDELRADIETCTAKRDEWADRAMTELGNVLDLRAENERLKRLLDLRGTGPAERYWEGRWRDEAAENERLRTEVKTLRKQAETLKEGWRISDEGRIEAESEIERLRAALQPFSEEAGYWISHNYSREDRPVEGFKGYTSVMTCGDLFNAHAALAQKGASDV